MSGHLPYHYCKTSIIAIGEFYPLAMIYIKQHLVISASHKEVLACVCWYLSRFETHCLLSLSLELGFFSLFVLQTSFTHKKLPLARISFFLLTESSHNKRRHDNWQLHEVLLVYQRGHTHPMVSRTHIYTSLSENLV